MRSKLALTAAAALLALTLAGCAGPAPTAAPSGDPSAAASAAPSGEPSAEPSAPPTTRPAITPITTIDGVKVTGGFGTKPTLEFKAPFAIDETRSKVLVAGTGAPVEETSYLDLNYLGVNAYTGEEFDSSWSRGEPAQFPLDQVVAGFKKGLVGKHVGDQVLIVIPGKDAYDAQGGSGDKILVGDTLIFVVDILDIDYQKPHGTAVTPAAGLPKVTADDKGVPNAAIDTAAAAPTASVVQPLIAGSSTKKVTAEDTIMVRYRMWSWKSGALLVDKYTGDPDIGKLSETIQCWREGVVNQTLGSRLMIVCPPATGYPEGSAEVKVEKGDTVVFVLDLIYAAKV